MRGNHFGKMFSFMSFGESHGEAMGVVIDGMPSQIEVNLSDLHHHLQRRAPGRHQAHTDRKEEDAPQILSGIFEGRTLGSPIAVIVKNTNQKSQDYEALKDDYRPGHADKTTILKFGHRDHRGGGRASGRETVARVIAGYFAGLILPQLSVYAYIAQVGDYKISKLPAHGSPLSELNIPEGKLSKEIENYLLQCKSEGESVGGIIHLSIENCPPALGEPAFDKLKADLSKAIMSIPAAVGVSIGSGFEFAHLKGSEISQETKHFGGMEGGISNGDQIFLSMVFKAPSTIGEKAKQGRHDPCLLPRAVPVVEAMAKVVLADHYLRQKAYLR